MNKNLMRVLCAVMAAVALFAMTACGGNTTETQPQTTTADTTPVETTEAAVTGNAVTFFSMSLGQDYENVASLNIYAEENGGAYVEYITSEKKVGNFGAELFSNIVPEIEKAGLAALNGQEVYEEGDANASMYIEFADGTAYTANFTGNIPEAYTTAYNAMDAYFAQLTADLAVYVPKPVVAEDVDPTVLAEMEGILNAAGIPNLDAFAISNVPMDDSFGFITGLSGTEGIAGGTACTPMMMTTAYSFVIVTLSDETKAADVAADFESSLDWRKWVCVAPSNALIAQKDNMILCVVGADELYTGTAAAVTAAGWTELKTLTNPDL